MHEPFGDVDRASIRGRLELGGKHLAGSKFLTRLVRQLFGQRVLNEETVVGPHAMLGQNDIAIPRGQRFRIERGSLGDSKGGEQRSHGKKSSLELHDAPPLAAHLLDIRRQFDVEGVFCERHVQLHIPERKSDDALVRFVTALLDGKPRRRIHPQIDLLAINPNRK